MYERENVYLRTRFRYKLRVSGQEGVAQRGFRIRGIVDALDQILMQMRSAISRGVLPAVAVEHGVVIHDRVVLRWGNNVNNSYIIL